MIATSDIAKIAEQERTLVFDGFDEARAFTLGTRLRERGLEAGMPIVVEVRTWDRLLFYAALPGSTSNNTEWIRRKLNVVKMFHKSTYRMVLEQGAEADSLFKPWYGLDIKDFVLAGGGFPITVRGVGVIGAIGVSGLPQRQDHALAVDVLAEHLGLDAAKLALDA